MKWCQNLFKDSICQELGVVSYSCERSRTTYYLGIVGHDPGRKHMIFSRLYKYPQVFREDGVHRNCCYGNIPFDNDACHVVKSLIEGRKVCSMLFINFLFHPPQHIDLFWRSENVENNCPILWRKILEIEWMNEWMYLLKDTWEIHWKIYMLITKKMWINFFSRILIDVNIQVFQYYIFRLHLSEKVE